MTAQPSVSPLHDPLGTIEALGKTHPAVAQLANGTMLISVLNDGTTEIKGGEATLKAGGGERHAVYKDSRQVRPASSSSDNGTPCQALS